MEVSPVTHAISLAAFSVTGLPFLMNAMIVHGANWPQASMNLTQCNVTAWHNLTHVESMK
jgi:hypothetical protein